MARASRAKGVAGQNETRKAFVAEGWNVRALQGQGDYLVQKNGVRFHVENKRQERVQLPMWLRQAKAEAPEGTIPLVTFRQSRNAGKGSRENEWYACLPLRDLLRLV